MIEELNRAVLDAPDAQTAPWIHDTVRALIQLVDRLPQSFEQLAAVLELRMSENAIRMDSREDSVIAARRVVEELRTASGNAGQLARQLGKPAGTLYSMAHHVAPDRGKR
ncbi:hypothetical protein OG317_00585 [Streptomyces sp. NBC_01167]|uniref:hypothetical protein n=1 Tax=Streptomyces sp. NBC_01167 TaxID=2903756 RepID=UPI00386B07EC|nr:hypothetical protein OG317_00585 [Streptomyces sp. NBC_01167]